MSETAPIKDRSKMKRIGRKAFVGLGRGLFLGLVLGAGAGLVFSGLGVAFGLSFLGAVGGVLNTAVCSAGIGGMIGAGIGALNGILTKPRPKGALSDQKMDSSTSAATEPGIELQPEIQQASALAPAAEKVTVPAAASDAARTVLRASTNAMTKELDEMRAQDVSWKDRVVRNQGNAVKVHG